MEQNLKNEKKMQSSFPVALVFMVAIGVAVGLISVRCDPLFASDAPFALLLFFVNLYLASYLQVILHETGHLIFGLLTGYRFSSFRIFSFMWVKLEDGKVHCKRLSFAGTGGQCLMAPPELKNGKMPYVLYHLGGVIVNTVTGCMFLALFFLLRTTTAYWASLFMLLGMFGFVYALSNGLPLNTGAVENDGRNALALGKQQEGLRALWVQLTMNERLANGARLRDLPEDYFEKPSVEGMKSGLIAALAVFACNRLMDEKRFEDAEREIRTLLHEQNGIIGVHRSLLACDLIYCLLVNGKNAAEIDQLLDKNLKKFMRSMKNNLSVIRTQYAYAMLSPMPDEQAALRALGLFESKQKAYPYAGDLESERELIDYVTHTAKK